MLLFAPCSALPARPGALATREFSFLVYARAVGKSTPRTAPKVRSDRARTGVNLLRGAYLERRPLAADGVEEILDFRCSMSCRIIPVFRRSQAAVSALGVPKSGHEPSIDAVPSRSRAPRQELLREVALDGSAST